jgi:DNA-binding MarR family transcriptional regulator
VNTNSEKTAYEITWLIRRLFRAMGQMADEYLQDSGLTAADRAVMEFLFPDKQLSVPEIAARYQVSRQHIQVTVNGLVQTGLLRTEPNPRHKRSPLLRLSELGRASFAEIRRRESSRIESLFADIDHETLKTTRNALKRIYENVD